LLPAGGTDARRAAEELREELGVTYRSVRGHGCLKKLLILAEAEDAYTTMLPRFTADEKNTLPRVTAIKKTMLAKAESFKKEFGATCVCTGARLFKKAPREADAR